MPLGARDFLEEKKEMKMANDRRAALSVYSHGDGWAIGWISHTGDSAGMLAHGIDTKDEAMAAAIEVVALNPNDFEIDERAANDAQPEWF